MKRLKTIMASNNRIGYIDAALAKFAPNIECLVFTNNELTELGDLDVLSSFFLHHALYTLITIYFNENTLILT